MNDGSSALLLNIIQLVVLIVGMGAAIKIATKGNQIVSGISNNTQGLAKRFGIEKGLDSGRKGIGSFAKNRALNTEAHMANADINTRRGRAARVVGGFRKNRSIRQKNRESIRDRMQEEAYYAGMVNPNLTANEQEARQARAMGIGGATAAEEAARLGRQAAGYADAKERERVAEELKHEALRLEAQIRPGEVDALGRGQAERLRAALQDAITNDEPIQVRAIMKRISEVGSKEDVAGMAEDITNLAQAPGGLSAAQQSAVAEGVQDNFGDLKARAPTLAGLDLTTGNQYGPVSPIAPHGTTAIAPEQLSTMAGSQLLELARNGSISREMVGAAAAAGTLKLDPGRQAQLENGLSSQYGAPQTVEALRVAHEAAPIIAANAAAPPPPPPPSDRRLKKNITQIDNYRDIPIYRFRYIWSNQEYVGTMAQDIIDTHPHAVSKSKGGYYRVDYSQLGFDMATYQDWLKKQ